jgi:hypothetical protein
MEHRIEHEGSSGAEESSNCTYHQVQSLILVVAAENTKCMHGRQINGTRQLDGIANENLDDPLHSTTHNNTTLLDDCLTKARAATGLPPVGLD